MLPDRPFDRAPVHWSEGLKFHMATSGIGAAVCLCPSGHRMGLRQDSNPRVSPARIARFGRIGSRKSQDRWNHKRTLVTLTLDDGRSSQAGAAAFVDASDTTTDCALGATTWITDSRSAEEAATTRPCPRRPQVPTPTGSAASATEPVSSPGARPRTWRRSGRWKTRCTKRCRSAADTHRSRSR